MPLGDRGDDVKELQAQLNDLGASLTVDGIWGPLTQGAYEQYGGDLPATSDPADPDAPAEPVDLNPNLEPGVDYTPDNERGRFNVIGGDPEIWYNSETDTWSVIYVVPDSSPPIPVYWNIPDESTLQAYFGPDATPVADKLVTNQDMLDFGGLFAGASTEIGATDQNPLEGWATLYEDQAKVRPYLRDPEVLSKIMAASLEGRSISKAELEGTVWWQGKTEKQREWAIMSEADPKTAQQLLDSNRQRVILDIQNAGISDPSEELISLMTNNFTSGTWTENQLVGQITAVADPYSPFTLTPEVQAIIGGVPMDGTQQEEDTVEELLQKWLGPVYGQWTDEQIAEKAGELRNDPDGQINFENQLRAQRVAMFPGYEDDSLTYRDIAQPWANFWQQQWGVQADETDPLFQQVLNTNDAVQNGSDLTKEGLRRGISKVTNDIQSKITRATGGSVAR